MYKLPMMEQPQIRKASQTREGPRQGRRENSLSKLKALENKSGKKILSKEELA